MPYVIGETGVPSFELLIMLIKECGNGPSKKLKDNFIKVYQKNKAGRLAVNPGSTRRRKQRGEKAMLVGRSPVVEEGPWFSERLRKIRASGEICSSFPNS